MTEQLQNKGIGDPRVGLVGDPKSDIYAGLPQGLADYLKKVEQEMPERSSFGATMLPPFLREPFLADHSPTGSPPRISQYLVQRLEKYVAQYGIIDSSERFQDGEVIGRTYDREHVLAFAVICWVVNGMRNKNDGSLDGLWKEAVDKTREILGEGHPLRGLIKVLKKEDASARLLVRASGKRVSNGGGGVDNGYQHPLKPVDEELRRSWTPLKLASLCNIPGLSDSISSMKLNDYIGVDVRQAEEVFALAFKLNIIRSEVGFDQAAFYFMKDVTRRIIRYMVDNGYANLQEIDEAWRSGTLIPVRPKTAAS